jgi:probable phosphoglycerate mutase
MSQTSRVVVLVRHGETEWTKSKQHTGRQDIPLTEEGRREAELLRHRLAAWPFSRVLVSPLSRARDTCALAGLADRAEVRPDLMEWDYGAYEGRTRTDILHERPEWSLWRDGCPQGETAEQVGVRADRIISELRGIEGGRGDLRPWAFPQGARRAVGPCATDVRRAARSQHGLGGACWVASTPRRSSGSGTT